MAEQELRNSRDQSDDDPEQMDQLEDERQEQEEESQQPEPRREAEAAKAGFFHVYKSGQGYWTRLGTAIGSGGVVVAILIFFYERMRVWLVDGATGRPRMGLIVGILGTVAVVTAVLIFRLLNRPRIVDFLVATESEMKKVNWTSRKDLVGSTKVVILFMFAIALFLFVVDVAFSYFFQLIRVLKYGPFSI